MLYINDYIMERCENGTVYDAVLCTQSILRMQFLCQCSRITLHAQIHQQIHKMECCITQSANTIL